MDTGQVDSTWVTQFSGLSEDEVKNRSADQDQNIQPAWQGASFRQILKKNLFNIFNLDLVGLVSLQLLFGKPIDALLSFLLLSAAILIGVIQELWAWNRLQLLSSTTSDKATVIRGGELREIDPRKIVLGDILFSGQGDQIFVEGEILDSDKFEVDEYTITEDSTIITKRKGDQVLAGTICVNGRAVYEATQAGLAKIDQLIAAQSEMIQPKTYSPLQKLINQILRVLLLIVAYFSFLLLIDNALDSMEIVNRSGLAGMIFVLAPSGLFFMIIVAYAMGAVRIADKGAVIPVTSSIEYLAQISVLCFETIGTSTTTKSHLELIEDQFGELSISLGYIQRILGNFARSVSTSHVAYQIIQEEYPGEQMPIVEEAPFISAYGWSGVVFDNQGDRGTFIIGDPKLLQTSLLDETSPKTRRSQSAKSGSGFTKTIRRTRRFFNRSRRATQEKINKLFLSQSTRVLLIAYRPEILSLHDADGLPQVPDDLIPLGYLRISEETHSESIEKLEIIEEAGVKLKLLASEEPSQVLDFAEQIGMIENREESIKIVSGKTLGTLDRSQFVRMVVRGELFSELTPELKAEIIQTLRELGENVAMVGENIHDLMAMHKANISIALRGKNSAFQSMADIYMLDNSIATLPKLFKEGQGVVNGLLDALKIYLTRIVYFLFLVLSIGLLGIGFPYTGKLAAVIGFVTVDLPAIAITVTARSGAQPKGRLSHHLLDFIVPAGILTGFAGFLVYLYFYSSTQDILYSQLTLTYTLIGCGALSVLFVQPPVKAFAVINQYRGNPWPAIVQIILVTIFFILSFTELGNLLFDIAPLASLRDYLIVGVVVFIWALILRSVWDNRFIRKYLELD